jgi:DNA-binding SARP family transcriptional activator/tetratricopeptide (TPR) repeat protein
MRVEFRVLGPLEALCDGVLLPVPSGRQRAILAALLLRANQVVAVDDLAAVLWGSVQPPSARVTVQNYVKRLRDALGDTGQRIVTRSPGYLIQVTSEELDVSLFDANLGAARATRRAASWQAAADHARAALSLWHGEPLADVQSEVLTGRAVPRLTELRMEALEIGIEAAVRLGRGAEVIGELRQLVADNPLRERFHALQMLALYGDGRQAEALADYQSARDTLVTELGAEPGPELREVQRKILTGDVSLIGTPLASEQARAAGVVPRELPAGVPYFTGREQELEFLTRLLEQGKDQQPTAVISVISGAAGVGKTALAVSWAHHVAGRFPDGQLYLNLRGYDPGEPVSAADALAGMLRTLGVLGTAIPDGVDDRARLYRSLLAGRRVLVLLDNARDGEQVRPLLPGDPGCVSVVTSRDALAGLVATDGARRLDLGVLPLGDAVDLLRSLKGPRADDDPDTTAQLAGLCARLPLALRIAAELTAARPGVPLAGLVAEFEADRLHLLDAGEDRADVRAVFSWSLRQQPDDVAAAFALLGLHPGTDLDEYAAAALTGTNPGQARRVLGRLHRASLVQASGPGRYGMHDLLREYAREQAAARDTGGQCDQALTRLFDFYLSAAVAATDGVFPAETRHQPKGSTTASVVPEMPGEAGSRAWLDAERANLAAAAMHCAGNGWPSHAVGLAGTLHRYLMTGSHLPEAHSIYGHALVAARRSGDLAGEASVLNGLGGIALMKGRFRDAAGHYLAALDAYCQCGDRAGEAKVLRNLGLTDWELHNLPSAAGYFRQAVAAWEEAGDSLGVASALADLAGAEIELGSYGQASEHLRRALPVLREAKDPAREAEALSRLGELSLRRGQLTQAAAFHEQALPIFRRLDYPTGVAAELGNLGEVSLRQGDCRRAISHLRQALALYHRTGNQYGEILTLRTLAEALHAASEPASARAELAAALLLAAETGNTYQQASTHRDLAESYLSGDLSDLARHHWQQALTLYTQLDAPEADQVRSRLRSQAAAQDCAH